MIKEEKLYLECNCMHEILSITVLEDEPIKKHPEAIIEKEISLAIFHFGEFIDKPSFWSRIKYCWYHLRTGKKYDDQLILNESAAKKLIKFLDESLKPLILPEGWTNEMENEYKKYNFPFDRFLWKRLLNKA